jgi:hypothetical protein
MSRKYKPLFDINFFYNYHYRFAAPRVSSGSNIGLQRLVDQGIREMLQRFPEIISGQMDKARVKQPQKGNKDIFQYVRLAEKPPWDISYIWSSQDRKRFITPLKTANSLWSLFEC